MEIFSVISLLVLFSPYTISTGHLMCNQGKCPKVNCFRGWQYKGYDMSGRYYTTCRFYTWNGKNLETEMKRIKGYLK